MSAHAQAFNLARRNSEKYENDLVQVNFFDDADDSKTRYSESFCSSLLSKMNKYSNQELPMECKTYPSVNNKYERMKATADKEEAMAFVGMSPADARNAQIARRQGHPNEAQIKRRLTSRSKQNQSSWF